MSTKYEEQLLDAVDILISKRINNLAYDFTKKCTITQTVGDLEGTYEVSDGATRFKAYSPDVEYKVDDQVRVNVPNGDMTQKKFIVGKWGASQVSEKKVIAAWDSVMGLRVGDFRYNNSIYSWQPDIGLPTHIFNSIAIRFNIVNTENKEYAIGLKINGDNNQIVWLPSSEMAGNPHNFVIPTIQELTVILDSNKISTITQLEIVGNNIQADNTTLSNVQYKIGYDIVNEENKTFKIGIMNGTTYSLKGSLSKTFVPLWINKNGNKYIGFTDGVLGGKLGGKIYNTKYKYRYNEFTYLNEYPQQEQDETDKDYEARKKTYENNYAKRYCLFWYCKDVSGAGDQFMPQGWKRLDNNLNNGIPVEVDSSGTDDGEVRASWKVQYDDTFVFNTRPRIYATETIKAVLVYNHEVYHSNEIVLSNSDITASLDGTSILTLQHGSMSQSSYHIYNQYSQLEQPTVAGYTRKVKAILEKSSILPQPEKINEQSKLLWKIPKNNTMLLPGGDREGQSEDNNFYYYVSYPSEDENGDITGLECPYKINEYYSPDRSDNTIYCEATLLNGTIFKGQISFDFGIQGNNGTKYTLVAKPAQGYTTDLRTTIKGQKKVNEDGTIAWDETNLDMYHTKIELSLFDPEGKKINWETHNNITIKWMWSLNADNTTRNSQFQWNLSGEEPDVLTVYNKWGILQFQVQEGARQFTTYYRIGYYPDEATNKISGSLCFTYNVQGSLINNHNPIPITYGNEDLEALELSESAKLLGFNFKPNSTILSPPPMYLQELSTASIYLRWGDRNNYRYEPIFIIQDVYGSEVLNQWDGKMILDGDKNYLLSAMVGAGKKTDNNTFTGVVMGDIGTLQDNTLDDTIQTGLFGYQNGIQSFGFKTDGTGFIGGRGGRIEFDGESGIIKGKDDGALTIDLFNNTIKSSKFTLSAGTKNQNNYIYLSNQSNGTILYDHPILLQLGNNFKVNRAGYMQASAGTIGGITIQDTSLHSSDTRIDWDKVKGSLAYIDTCTIQEITLSNMGPPGTKVYQIIRYPNASAEYYSYQMLHYKIPGNCKGIKIYHDWTERPINYFITKQDIESKIEKLEIGDPIYYYKNSIITSGSFKRSTVINLKDVTPEADYYYLIIYYFKASDSQQATPILAGLNFTASEDITITNRGSIIASSIETDYISAAFHSNLLIGNNNQIQIQDETLKFQLEDMSCTLSKNTFTIYDENSEKALLIATPSFTNSSNVTTSGQINLQTNKMLCMIRDEVFGVCNNPSNNAADRTYYFHADNRPENTNGPLVTIKATSKLSCLLGDGTFILRAPENTVFTDIVEVNALNKKIRLRIGQIGCMLTEDEFYIYDGSTSSKIFSVNKNGVQYSNN